MIGTGKRIRVRKVYYFTRTAWVVMNQGSWGWRECAVYDRFEDAIRKAHTP